MKNQFCHSDTVSGLDKLSEFKMNTNLSSFARAADTLLHTASVHVEKEVERTQE